MDGGNADFAGAKICPQQNLHNLIDIGFDELARK
jgi:hypothetical protein